MKTRTAIFFECNVRYERNVEDGSVKKVSEIYVVDALSFTETEERITKEIIPYVQGDFDVMAIKRTQYGEFINVDGNEERFYKAKVVFITIDEKTAKEKHPTTTLCVPLPLTMPTARLTNVSLTRPLTTRFHHSTRQRFSMCSSMTPMPMSPTDHKSFDELLRKARSGKPPRSTCAESEHRIQCACVRWFGLQYPQFRGRLFAVPNGGGRSKAEAAKLVAEGVVAGVSDLILLLSNHDYGALLIEMKTEARHSHQSERQVWWQSVITANDEYKYVVCRSLDDFMREVRQYINDVL